MSLSLCCILCYFFCVSFNTNHSSSLFSRWSWRFKLFRVKPQTAAPCAMSVGLNLQQHKACFLLNTHHKNIGSDQRRLMKKQKVRIFRLLQDWLPESVSLSPDFWARLACLSLFMDTILIFTQRINISSYKQLTEDKQTFILSIDRTATVVLLGTATQDIRPP